MQQTKQMLETRVGQVTQYNDKITNIQEQVNQIKWMNQEFMKKTADDIFQQKQSVGLANAKMDELQERTRQKMNSVDLHVQSQGAAFGELHKKMDGLTTFLNNKFEEFEMEMSFRIRHDEVRQNFKILNDLLFVKF